MPSLTLSPSSKVWRLTGHPRLNPPLILPPSRPMAPPPVRVRAPAAAIKSTAGSSRRSTAQCGTGSPNTWTTTRCATLTPSSGTTSATWPALSASMAADQLTEAPKRRRSMEGRCQPRPQFFLLHLPPAAAQRPPLLLPCSPSPKTQRTNQPGRKAPPPLQSLLESRSTLARRWTAQFWVP